VLLQRQEHRQQKTLPEVIAEIAVVETIPEVTLSHWDSTSARWTFVAELGPCGLEEPSAGPRKRGKA